MQCDCMQHTCKVLIDNVRVNLTQWSKCHIHRGDTYPSLQDTRMMFIYLFVHLVIYLFCYLFIWSIWCAGTASASDTYCEPIPC